jgi:hypothetical protein
MVSTASDMGRPDVRLTARTLLRLLAVQGLGPGGIRTLFRRHGTTARILEAIESTVNDRLIG